MIARRTRLKRSAPPRKKRPGPPRRGQPTRAEKTAIRLQVYEETGGQCQLHLLPNCIRGVLPFEGGVRERWHLVHKRSKRLGGWGRENLCGGCPVCHLDGIHLKGLKIPTDSVD